MGAEAFPGTIHFLLGFPRNIPQVTRQLHTQQPFKEAWKIEALYPRGQGGAALCG